MNQYQGGPPQAQVNVNFEDLQDVKCDACGDLRFEQILLLKRVSALYSPTGKPGVIPVPVFACLSCGHVNAEFVPKTKTNGETKKEETQTTSLELLD